MKKNEREIASLESDISGLMSALRDGLLRNDDGIARQAGSIMKTYYEDGNIKIYHGDCRDILGTMEDRSVDLVLTDPPYGNNNNLNDLAARREAALGIGPPGPPRPIANDSEDEANDLVMFLFSQSQRLLVMGGCCCCCCCGGGPNPQFARWALWMDEFLEFKQMVIWDKGGLGMGWHYRRSYEVILVGEKPGAPCKWYGGNTTSNLIRINKIIPQKQDHPTPKPVGLMRKFIELHTLPGDLVLDPFCGAGPTLLAAKETGRAAIGIELEEKYCEMAANRLRQGVLL